MKQLPKNLNKQLLLTGGMSVVLVIIAVFLENRTQEPNRVISRPFVGQNGVMETILVELGDEIKELPLSVGAVEYTPEQLEELQKKTEQWVLRILPGQNESLEYVTENLVFPLQTEEGGEIRWSTDAPWLIKSDGTVCNETLETSMPVEITAKIAYGPEMRVFSCMVTVQKREYSEEELFLHRLEDVLREQEEATRTEQVFELPEKVQGAAIFVKESDNFSVSAFLFLVAFLLPVLVCSNYFSEKEKKEKLRKAEFADAYVEFITKLSLLMAAGVTVRQCFYRLAEEYEKNYGEAYALTKELKQAKQELDHGYSESLVYDSFGRRCGVLSYQRMASLLVQNNSKGIQGIRGLLLQEAGEVMAQEHANIKVRGEQAGTKLLLPMMGLLFLVFAILLMPAFQSF